MTAGRVAWIAIAPVKALALVELEAAELTREGIAGDRRYCLVDTRARMINDKVCGALATVSPDVDERARTLALRFPDGRTVADELRLGDPIEALFFGRPRSGRLVHGPWSAALSGLAGIDLRLVRLDDADTGVDRAPDGGAVTLLSEAALASLGAAAGRDRPLDRRRFRMTIGVAGVAPNAEDGWLGRRVRVGGATVVPHGNVGRCVVTTQDPDTGRPDVDTLGTLRATRGHLPTTEPLPFGVWAEVAAAGPVALGDTVDAS